MIGLSILLLKVQYFKQQVLAFEPISHQDMKTCSYKGSQVGVESLHLYIEIHQGMNLVREELSEMYYRDEEQERIITW